jgi:hypothetical protein
MVEVSALKAAEMFCCWVIRASRRTIMQDSGAVIPSLTLSGRASRISISTSPALKLSPARRHMISTEGERPRAGAGAGGNNRMPDESPVYRHCFGG